MLATTLLAVLALGSGNASRPVDRNLAIHVTHHPDDLNAARLAEGFRKACAAPSVRCRIAEPSEATTLLYLEMGKYCKFPAGTTVVDPTDCTGGRTVFRASAYITSRVMLPGSVSVHAESPDGLGPSLLALVKDRLAEQKGVVVIDRTDAR